MSNIKVIEKFGKAPGKTAVILAGVHGNETCGIKAFDKIIPSLKIKSGRVLFVYSNLEAMRQNKRFIEENLNRCFLSIQPKEISWTLEGKTAEEIKPYLDSADFLLDIHASNSVNSVPFIITDINSLEIAETIPCKIVSLNWDSFEKGTTDYYMHLSNKKGICFESGYIKDKKSIIRAEDAIISFLASLGFIERVRERPDKKEFFEMVSIYKNNKYAFKKSRDFADFEILKEKTSVGKEGNKDVFLDAGFAVVFVRDRENLDNECFLVARKMGKSQI